MADDMTLCVECGKPAQLNNRGEWLACHSCSPAVGPLCGDCMARHIGEHSLAAEYGYVDSPLSPALERIAALEADNARLRQLAEVGEAVEGMELGDGLFREGEHEWRVRSDLEYETSNWEIVDNAPTPLAAFEAMKQKRAEYEAAVARADDAALRAAKGEEPDHAH